VKPTRFKAPVPAPVTTVKLSVLLVSLALTAYGQAEGYYFDPALLQGGGYGKSIALERFNQTGSALSAGQYTLDIYLNNQLLRSQESVMLSTSDDQQKTISPCLTPQQIEFIGLRNRPAAPESEASCQSLSQISPDITWDVDMATLRLNLHVPQARLIHMPHGYIPVSDWEAGAVAMFLRHNTNYTRTENTANHYRYDYLWSNINSGVNAGLWQVHHQGNLRYANSNHGGSDYKYNAVRTWVQRPLPQIESELSLGDTYTNSSLFGSLSFNGMKLSTDERMWPQGRRGYAPEVRGVAATTARVVVKQQGRVIYETTVSPGAFVINDLYNTRNQGDLVVDVVEANGKISTFTVPYAAVPDSVRPGNWSYELAMGKVRNYYGVDNHFLEGVLQRGINNVLTTNTGVRVGHDYQAGLLGGVVATRAGALALNTVYSHAKTENNRSEQGWRVEASYSKTFTTGTNLVLAAYRYSTNGYRDLQDVLGVRRQAEQHISYYSDTLKQRNNFSVTASQNLDAWGMLNLTGSTSDYYDNASRITQLQFGYSNTWHNINFNLNASRQRSIQQPGRFYQSVRDSDYREDGRRKYTENTISLGISLPLDFGENQTRLSLDMNRGSSNRSAMAGISGSAGERGTLTYSAWAGTDQYDGNGTSSTVGGNLEQRTSMGNFRANAASGKDYRQYGIGLSSTLVAHRGGLTAGPYTSETFALIHAPGARGAEVRNGQGAVIDRFGYALLPSLTPYRYNDVSLDSRNMNDDTELQGGSKRVVPYSGAIPVVRFTTVSGKAVLISTVLSDGSKPPMGAEALNADGEVVGTVGQGGQIYARLPAQSGVLSVEWGKQRDQRCRVSYQLPATGNNPVSQLTLPCRQE